MEKKRGKWKCLLLSGIWFFVTPVDCSPPGSSVHVILRARKLIWVAIPFSRGSSPPRDWTWVSCNAGRYFTVWGTRETQLVEYLLCLGAILSTYKP